MSRVSSIVNPTKADVKLLAKITENEVKAIKQDICNRKQQINQEIDKPKHYASKSGKDVIDWCEDFGIMQNAYVFNIFKYLCRAGKKDNNSELQDALKAEVYLKRYIDSLKEEL